MPVPPTVLSNMDHTFHTFEEVEQMDDGALARIGLKWEEYGQGEGIAIKCTLCDAWVPNSGHLISAKHGRKLRDYLWQADVRARRAMAKASNDNKAKSISPSGPQDSRLKSTSPPPPPLPLPTTHLVKKPPPPLPTGLLKAPASPGLAKKAPPPLPTNVPSPPGLLKAPPPVFKPN